METKTVDSRGRINLGKEFANKTCFFEKIGETEIRLELAAVIPERELWLYKNPEAKPCLRSDWSKPKQSNSAHLLLISMPTKLLSISLRIRMAFTLVWTERAQETYDELKAEGHFIVGSQTKEEQDQSISCGRSLQTS